MGPITFIDFDRTGRLVVTCSTDRIVKVWDLKNKYQTHNLRGHEGLVKVAKFHPDPHKLQLLSAGEDATLRVWDLVQQDKYVGEREGTKKEQ